MDLGSILQCSVCHDPFTRPKVLPCQHTYCYSCLLGLVREEKSATCPQCRGVHQLPDAGVEGLPDNLTIKNLLDLQGLTLGPDLYAETVLCNDCTNAASVSSCDHCQEKLCSKCLVKHAKLVGQIENSLLEFKDFLKSHSEVSDDDLKRDNLDGINFEEERIDFEFDKVQEELEKRRQYFKDYFAMIKLLYQDLSAVKVGEACAIDPAADQANLTYTSVESLNSFVRESKTSASLESLRLRVNDARSAARLVVRGERFRFVWEGVELGELARVEAGEGTVRIEGLYGDAGIREQKTPREQSRQAAPTQPQAAPPQPEPQSTPAQQEVLKQQELLWQQIKNLNLGQAQLQAQVQGQALNRKEVPLKEEQPIPQPLAPSSNPPSSQEMPPQFGSNPFTVNAASADSKKTRKKRGLKEKPDKCRSRGAPVDNQEGPFRLPEWAVAAAHRNKPTTGPAIPDFPSSRDEVMGGRTVRRLARTDIMNSAPAQPLQIDRHNKIKLGSRVKVQRFMEKGVVRWMGLFEEGCIAGLEMDRPRAIYLDKYEEKSWFTGPENKVHYVDCEHIEVMEPETTVPEAYETVIFCNPHSPAVANNHPRINELEETTDGRIKVGMRVQLKYTSGRIGTVQWIGMDSAEQWVGIEMDETQYGYGTNSTLFGAKWFECPEGKAEYTLSSRVEPLPHEEHVLKINEFDGYRKGQVVKYLGEKALGPIAGEIKFIGSLKTYKEGKVHFGLDMFDFAINREDIFETLNQFEPVNKRPGCAVFCEISDIAPLLDE